MEITPLSDGELRIPATELLNRDLPAGFTDEDGLKMHNYCVLGAGVAKALFPFSDPMNDTVRLGSYFYQVVGVLRERAATRRDSAPRHRTHWRPNRRSARSQGPAAPSPDPRSSGSKIRAHRNRRWRRHACRPTPIGAGAATNTAGLITVTPEEQAAAAAAFPLVDSLRRWVAPFTGTIDITGQVALTQSGDAAADEAELITDGQGSAAYKRQLVRVHVARALRAALDDSGARH